MAGEPSPSSSDYRPGGRPFTGRKMLWSMLGFFAVILAANLTMAWFAVKDFRGTVVDSGFVASQDFNADRARFAEQAARGWTVELAAEGGRPRLAFRDAAGEAIAGLAVTAVAMWPLDQRRDRPLAFVETGPGVHHAVEPLDPGKWRVAFIAEGVGPRYAATAELVVGPGS
jgi:nitrogen fixation protein FixH